MSSLTVFMDVASALLLLLAFPEESNSQSMMYNLGTVIISGQNPLGPDGYPSIICTEDVCEGLVWLYYSDVNRVRQWGTVSRVNASSSLTVLCQQLGYKNGTFSRQEIQANNSYPVWLDSLHCADGIDYTNILQCGHSHCEQSASCDNHARDLVIKCEHELPPSNYLGGIYLQGPNIMDNEFYGIQKTFGVIQIRLFKIDRIFPITIDSVNDIEHFQNSKRDSICQQMGFTRAVTDSVYTVQALHEYGYSFDYSKQASWFNIDDTTLNGKCTTNENIPSPCFSCCYDYSKISHNGCSGDEGCSPGTNALVIACDYDPHTENPDNTQRGSEETCKSDVNGKMLQKSICNNDPSKVFFICFISLLLLNIFVILIVIVVLVVYKAVKLHPCRLYGRIGENEQRAGDHGPPREE